MTFMIYNINNEIPFYPSDKSDITVGGSYYKFYQLKLRQLLTQTRYRKEQETRLARQKTPITAERFNQQQRLHKEYIHQLREQIKVKSEDQKPADSNTKPERIISPAPRTPLIPKTKPISPSSNPRVISAPITNQRTFHKPQRNEQVSSMTIQPITRLSSSSRQRPTQTHRQARRSILDTIMLHLNSHQLPTDSKWSTYQDIHHKFSASISPSVYRNFERDTV